MTNQPPNGDQRADQIEVDGTTYVPLAEVSALLDEVWLLRRALAYEAACVEAQTLDLKSLGKGRRRELEESIDRMTLAALGDADVAYADKSSLSLRYAMRKIGMRERLFRWDWRDQRADPLQNARSSTDG